ncbi:hypothetical protein I5W30_08755 [Stenotrophomonas maltophilia]|nr:hypothetical protein [Stenotrophomonas maltophilia]
MNTTDKNRTAIQHQLTVAQEAINALADKGLTARSVSITGARPVIVIDRPCGDSLVGAQHIRERKGELVTRTKMATPFHGCQVEWDVCQSTSTGGLH